MKLKELKQARAALIKEMRTMLDKADEEKRGLTDVEQTKYDELSAEVDARAKDIEREERQIQLESHLGEPADEPIKNQPAKPEGRGFKSLGEQLKAVVNASSPGARNIDPRLLESRLATGLGETVPADGGFLVQTDFSTELLKRAYETGVLASRVKKIPISANADGIKINAIDETSRANGSRWGGVQIYWAAEAATVTAKKPKFMQMELKLNKLMGLCYVTDELLKDTSALESVITQAFSEEFGFVIDDSIMNGSGSGQPLGFMNSGALVTLTRTTTVTVKFADITAMWARLYAPSRANSVWLINQIVEPKLMGMTLTDYVPAYLPPGGLSVSPYGTLMGRPVIPIEQCPTVGTTGDIALVDLSQYIMIEKGGLETASSIHVQFLYDEQVFRFIYRCDGQPSWTSALTPKAGSTLSPFVVLSTL